MLHDDLRLAVLLVLVSLHRNGNLCPMPWTVLVPFAPKGKQGHCTGRRPPGARLVSIVMGLLHGHLTRYPCLDLLSTRSLVSIPNLSMLGLDLLSTRSCGWLVLFIEALVLFPNIEREGRQRLAILKGNNGYTYPD